MVRAKSSTRHAAGWIDDELMQKSKQSGNSIGFVTDTATHDGEQIEVRPGISCIGEDQAHRNLEREIPKVDVRRGPLKGEVGLARHA